MSVATRTIPDYEGRGSAPRSTRTTESNPAACVTANRRTSRPCPPGAPQARHERRNRAPHRMDGGPLIACCFGRSHRRHSSRDYRRAHVICSHRPRRLFQRLALRHRSLHEDNGFGVRIVAGAINMSLEQEDFSMLPAFDKSPSPDYSEPYRLLAPLVVLSFPSGVALPRLGSDVPLRSAQDLVGTGQSDTRPH